MQMQKQAIITIYHDTRRIKKNNKYPVKLRVYANQTRKQKFYPIFIAPDKDQDNDSKPISFEFSMAEYKSIMLTDKPRSENRRIRTKLLKYQEKAESVASKINPFTFEKFEKKMELASGEAANVFFHYNQIIERNRKRGRFGNASSYEYSLKSLKGFVKFITGVEPEKLNFIEINKDWLNDYEDYMLNELERTRTTIGIFMRALRAVFNRAIEDKDISEDLYPFGKSKYEIPTARKSKKALTQEQIKKLFLSVPKTPEQEKAKDYWFFSYSCNGMNIKDIALLRFKDLKDDRLEYYRAKTINTNKTDLKPISVYLNGFSQLIIEKYGAKERSSDALIFPIISKALSKEEQHFKIKNFTRFVNQHLKKLAKAEELPEDISTYWARHTFSTMAIRKGQSMEFVSEALNHSDLKTTQNYMAGFEDDVKKEFANTLMNF
jgi:integrase/recombinase XerD